MSRQLERDRAQRWHDTDHGPLRKAVKRRGPHPFAVWAKLKDPDWVSSCWCCCELCDPDWNEERPNPYWGRAHGQLVAGGQVE